MNCVQSTSMLHSWIWRRLNRSIRNSVCTQFYIIPGILHISPALIPASDCVDYLLRQQRQLTVLIRVVKILWQPLSSKPSLWPVHRRPSCPPPPLLISWPAIQSISARTKPSTNIYTPTRNSPCKNFVPHPSFRSIYSKSPPTHMKRTRKSAVAA